MKNFRVIGCSCNKAAEITQVIVGRMERKIAGWICVRAHQLMMVTRVGRG